MRPGGKALRCAPYGAKIRQGMRREYILFLTLKRTPKKKLGMFESNSGRRSIEKDHPK